MSDPHEHSRSLRLLLDVVIDLEQHANKPAIMIESLARIGLFLGHLAGEAQKLEFRVAALELDAELRAGTDASFCKDPLQARVLAAMSAPNSNVVPLPLERPLTDGAA